MELAANRCRVDLEASTLRVRAIAASELPSR